MSQPSPRLRITDLDLLIGSLSAENRARFDRIFHVSADTGKVVPPEAMVPWIVGHFGSADAVRQQRIVKVTNRILMEGALFNELRASRPIEAPPGSDDLEETVRRSAGGPFCRPLQGTPADVFGRIQGKSCLSASNVAKYDVWHGVMVFDEHHPLHFGAAQVADYVDTAQAWARAAYEADPEACYPFFIWNCLWRSGASILHGHAQMALTRGMHYAKVEAWRQATLRYRAAYDLDYFQDLIAVHQALDLAVAHGSATILPSLTPFKEKETHIVSAHLDRDAKSALFLVLSTFIQRLGVQSFNVALYQPPLAETAEDWSGFPFVFRIVDRGNLRDKTSDVGAMEFFGQSVVATDPWRVAAALRGVGLPGTQGQMPDVSNSR